MSEEKKSSWDSLADQLGATPRDESTESAREREQGHGPSAPSHEPHQEYREPTRPSSGWDSLLDEFGIDAPQPPPTGAGRECASEPPRSEARPEPEAGRARRREVGEVEPERADEPLAGGVEFAEKLASDDEPISPPAQIDSPSPVEEEAPADLDAARPAKDLEATATPAARPNAWDSAPKSQLSLPDWFPFAGRRTKEPPAAPAEAPSEARAPADGPSEERPPAEPRDETQTADYDSAAEGGSTTGDGDDAEQRPRGRRRRGRRRRRSSGEDAGPAAEATEKPVDIDESPEDSDLESNEVDPEDEQDDSAGRKSGSHRSIPSWADAISVVVDSNIAARSERKKASRSGNVRGRRGGGRRKRKSTS